MQLTDVSSDGKSVKFGGLPSGYRMTTGDLFHFNFGPSSAYRAMHRIIVGDAANGSGYTTWMEIRPRVADPDLTTPRTVPIRHPAAKMKLLRGGYEPGTGPQNDDLGHVDRSKAGAVMPKDLPINTIVAMQDAPTAGTVIRDFVYARPRNRDTNEEEEIGFWTGDVPITVPVKKPQDGTTVNRTYSGAGQLL